MTNDADPLWVAPGESEVTGTVPVTDSTPVGGIERPRIGRRRSWLRRIRRTIGGVAALCLAYFLVSLFQVWSTGRAHERGSVDAIVVLGAAQYDGVPSPQLAARLDHVVEMYEAGQAPLVVTTGGKLPGDRFTESEASAAYLIERGVPADVILQETEGRSTWESLEGVAAMLTPYEIGEVVLVSDPYHMLRSRLIAEEVGLDASVSSTSTSPVRGWTALVKNVKEAAGVAVGRVIGFERLWKVTG